MPLKGIRNMKSIFFIVQENLKNHTLSSSWKYVCFRCREKIFLEATEPTNTGQAPSLRKPRQKPEINGTRSSIRSISPAGRTPPLLTRTVTVKHDSKKETRRSREDKTPRYVQLQKDVFQEVIITHVVNDCSYFVTLAANSEEVQRIAYQTNCTAVNGTATEPYVGNIYGAKLGGIWWAS